MKNGLVGIGSMQNLVLGFKNKKKIKKQGFKFLLS
jgi:hypothetical protein